MSIARLSRDSKRQLGQFLTPPETASAIVKKLSFSPNAKILEPSFGNGSFIFPILDSIALSVPFGELAEWCETHLYGCEIDNNVYAQFTENWKNRGLGGGMKYFGREGLTWSLIAPRLYVRYLPSGYILDSGAPCAFLRQNVDHEELFFIFGWALTDLCNIILKKVLNHTRNIQSKDFERLPYPIWVDAVEKQKAISAVRDLIVKARTGNVFSFQDNELQELNDLYMWRGCQAVTSARQKNPPQQLSLF